MSSVTEAAFEEHIAGWLVEHGGYRRVKIGNVGDGPRDFDAEAGIDTADLFEFIGATQGSKWARLVDTAYGGDPSQAQSGFVQRLAAELDKRGTVDVLRRGVVDRNITIRLAYFRPAHRLTPELATLYEANVLSVTRQLPFDPASGRTVDLGLFVNGVPAATAELKNPPDGPDRRERRRPVPQQPSAQQPDPGPGGHGSLRGRSVVGDDDHPPGWRPYPVPAVQPGPQPGRGQPLESRRAPHRLPVGAGVEPRRLDGHPGTLRACNEAIKGIPGPP